MKRVYASCAIYLGLSCALGLRKDQRCVCARDLWLPRHTASLEKRPWPRESRTHQRQTRTSSVAYRTNSCCRMRGIWWVFLSWTSVKWLLLWGVRSDLSLAVVSWCVKSFLKSRNIKTFFFALIDSETLSGSVRRRCQKQPNIFWMTRDSVGLVCGLKCKSCQARSG